MNRRAEESVMYEQSEEWRRRQGIEWFHINLRQSIDREKFQAIQ